jgi:hypothetical protein
MFYYLFTISRPEPENNLSKHAINDEIKLALFCIMGSIGDPIV